MSDPASARSYASAPVSHLRARGGANADIMAEFRRRAREVDVALDRLVPRADVRPITIHAAIRHSLFAGGKRIRPLLTLAAGEALGAPAQALMPVACAMEMIHAASLIHDDLPAMDNADVRRGRPTCHREFGEAVAILAGDALIALAFHVIANACDVLPAALSSAQAARISAELGRAVGSVQGLIAGQVIDLESEGRAGDADRVMFIHHAKTSALVVASTVAGGIVAGVDDATIAVLRRYGERIGLAFQIVDDVLDASATAEQLGKAVGRDAAAGKTTYPAIYGIEASRAMAEALVDDAIDDVRSLGVDGRWLEAIAGFVTERLS
ncbi:polyprenyl synthetase family protein [Pendulispora brunnea]|uniref:Polyprenyl synthetase family protein n=1 Tax=Pendulispora brunnea TaxID=2905690 RepID=A0ABZ2JYL8_9BACT